MKFRLEQLMKNYTKYKRDFIIFYFYYNADFKAIEIVNSQNIFLFLFVNKVTINSARALLFQWKNQRTIKQKKESWGKK